MDQGAAQRVGRRRLGEPVDRAEAVHQRAGHEVARPARRDRAEHVDAVDRRRDPLGGGLGSRGRGRTGIDMRRLTIGESSDSPRRPRAPLSESLARLGVCPTHRSSSADEQRKPRPPRPAGHPADRLDRGHRRPDHQLVVHRRAAHLADVRAAHRGRCEPGLGFWKYVAGFVFAVVLYLSVLLHEASHAVVAQRLGYGVNSITLHFLGGMTEIDGQSRTPRHEFWIAVVGPLTSIAVGIAAVGAQAVVPTASCGSRSWPCRAPTSSSASSTSCPGCPSTAAACSRRSSGAPPATSTGPRSSPGGAVG